EIKGTDVKDIIWLTPNGSEMSDQEWRESSARCLGVFLSGVGLGETDQHGRPLHDENFLWLLNAHHEAIEFRLPALDGSRRWHVLIDTCDDEPIARDDVAPGEIYPLQGRSLVLLLQVHSNATQP